MRQTNVIAAWCIDADLQDDLDVLNAMVISFSKGNQVVYGARNNRDVDICF